ncbi:hypothetical protein ACI65C_012366 [Semiaphis heraclei]
MIIKLPSKRCSFLIGLVILMTIAVLFIFYSLHIVKNEIQDPEFPEPPSSLPMGVYSKVGVVSNGGPCSQIGVDVMSRGGNAIDATIATLLCDGAVCPQQMGIGGGFIMSIYNATTKKVTTINARETAPAAANTYMFVNEPRKSMYGGLAVAIPGALKGYSTIYNLYGGGVEWETLFGPTIKLCEEGITVSDHLEFSLKFDENLIYNNTILRNIFTNVNSGGLKTAGDTYKLPKLADTLKIIAVEGVNAIYNGSLTTKIVHDLRKANGIITNKDLSDYKVEIEEAFSVNLTSGHTIHMGPPPGSGIILAYILRILDGILPAPDVGLDEHRLVEAFKFGYGERSHLGDHQFVNVSQIYNKVSLDSYIESIRNKILDDFTSLDPRYYGGDFYTPEDHGTANIVVTDSMGNTVVCTSTINTFFGSGFVSPSTGIIFNNQMNDFSTPGVINFYRIPSSPANYIEPGKRPMSSMSPTIFTDTNGDFMAAHKLWYNNTLKEVLDKPRIYHQLVPMEIQYEYRTTKNVVQKLKDIGHPVIRMDYILGSAASAISKSPTGMIEAMSDFRRPGNTSGY